MDVKIYGRSVSLGAITRSCELQIKNNIMAETSEVCLFSLDYVKSNFTESFAAEFRPLLYIISF